MNPRIGRLWCGVLVASAAAVGGGSACQPAHGGGGSVQLTASGEVLALDGYAFPPLHAGDPAFVDGWEVKLDELLVTYDHFTLWENPDKSAADQSQVDAPVASVSGPWAVDLHAGGPLPGKAGNGEQAVALAMLDGDALDDTRRYAFGYDIVVASERAKRVNLSAQAKRDYAEMIARGYSVLYVGTATWKGGDSCNSSDPSYDFSKLPKLVSFRLGFKSPTRYVNCQNPDNDPASPLGGEEHQRGLQTRANTTTIAQATLHTDHPFWESFQHDAAAHFDTLAANAKLVGSDFVVTSEDLVGVDYTAFTDRDGHDLPWRSCLPSYTPPDRAPAMHFDSLGIPFDPTGKASEVMRDYRDFVTYDQSTQGHLNSDGLCFVQRRYPSPL